MKKTERHKESLEDSFPSRPNHCNPEDSIKLTLESVTKPFHSFEKSFFAKTSPDLAAQNGRERKEEQPKPDYFPLTTRVKSVFVKARRFRTWSLILPLSTSSGISKFSSSRTLRRTLLQID